MNQNFANELTAKLTELVAGLRYYNKPTKNMMVPYVVETMLPPKERGYKEGEHFPLICWAITGGQLSFRKPQPFDVVIDVGLAVDESAGTSLEQIIRGTASIMEITRAIGGLAASRVVAGYKLQLPFEFSIGDPENPGRQPHPYYWVQFKLSFLAPN